MRPGQPWITLRIRITIGERDGRRQWSDALAQIQLKPIMMPLKTMTSRRSNERPAKRTAARNGADAKFRAFSDPTRLRILHLLQQGELCVGDLVRIIQVPQPTASRHLAYLRRAGLVVTRKEGVWTYYALAKAGNSFHKKLLECLGHCFNEVRELASDAIRAAKIRQGGGCCPK